MRRLLPLLLLSVLLGGCAATEPTRPDINDACTPFGGAAYIHRDSSGESIVYTERCKDGRIIVVNPR